MARQTSFRERTMRTTRRRRRLSLELAGMLERELSTQLYKHSFSESLNESGERLRASTGFVLQQSVALTLVPFGDAS